MADGHGWEHEVTPTTIYQGTQQEGVEHGHEDIDLNLRTVLKWFGAWAVTVTISIFVLWWLFDAWSNYSTRQELLLPNPQFNLQLQMPEPRVLPNPIDSPPGSSEPMKGPAELERDHRRLEDQALQRVGLQDANGQPALPPAAVAALTHAPATPASGYPAAANDEVRLQPSGASGGTALENQLAGE